MRGVVVARIILAGIVLIIGAEVVARVHLKYGSPVLYRDHGSIEYMLRPNQDARPYGKQQFVNEMGMRSPSIVDVTAERRILVFGDSVLNGGTGTDHADLATTLLSNQDVFYGNVSANSWGPANHRAWLKQFGSLGAEAAIVLLSSHDATDLPSFEPASAAERPASAPLFALQEAWPKVLDRIGLKQQSEPPLATAVEDDEVKIRGAAELKSLLDAFDRYGLKVCLIQHQTKHELATVPDEGWYSIQSAFAQRGWPIVQLAQWTGPAVKTKPEIFTDDIHLAPEGQKLIAKAITTCTAKMALPSLPAPAT